MNILNFLNKLLPEDVIHNYTKTSAKSLAFIIIKGVTIAKESSEAALDKVSPMIADIFELFFETLICELRKGLPKYANCNFSESNDIANVIDKYKTNLKQI